MRNWAILLVLPAMHLGLAGCLMKRDEYALPSVELPDKFQHAPVGNRTAVETVETAPGTVPQSVSRWWRHYRSPELNRLVEEGLANNYSLKAAIARIAQAQAQAGVERADEWPELSGSGSYEIESPTQGIGGLDNNDDRKSQHLYQVGVAASYELDLWGKNRAKTEAAVQRAWASLFARETVALTLTADIVRNYVEYLSLLDRIRNADWTRTTLSNMLQAVSDRVAGGEATNLQLKQQEAAVAASKAVIPVLELQREQRRNALALLIGKAPADLKLDGQGLADLAFPDASNPGVPSRLILRRPDVREIEANMIAADADIDAARAELLPAFNFTAEAGYGARHLDLLFAPQSLFWSAGATVTQIIFDAGRRESTIKFEEAQHKELVHNYMQAIYTSVNEVENALVSIKYLSERRTSQKEAELAADAAYGFAQQSYSIGATDYLSLLDTERTLFTERDELLRVDFERYVATVDLFRALGGSMAPKQVLVVSNTDRDSKSKHPSYFTDEDAWRPTSQMQPNLPQSGHWIHMASLWSEHAAWRHWRRMQQRFPKQLKEVSPEIQRQKMTEGTGSWVSVLVGPFGKRPDASDLCTAFRQKGDGCQVLTR